MVTATPVKPPPVREPVKEKPRPVEPDADKLREQKEVERWMHDAALG